MKKLDALLVLSVVSSPLLAGDEARSPDFFERMVASWETGFQKQQRQLQGLWAREAEQQKKQWQRAKQEITRLWGNYYPSTQTRWVSYSADKHAVNVVDFRKGEVTIEALLPAKAGPDLQRKILQRQLQRLLMAKDVTGRPVMQGLLPQKRIDQPPTLQTMPDTSQIKVSTKLSMVPDHMARRAARYFHIVREQARLRNLDPALLLAVIHTESAFNPMARSDAPAYGLMQLVPQWGAKEAYQALYGVEKLLSPAYLYQPANNIELGATYLNLLENRYFPEITDPMMRRFLMISAYNRGPTVVKQALETIPDFDKLSVVEFYRQLRQALPEETRNYLANVVKRTRQYAQFNT